MASCPKCDAHVDESDRFCGQYGQAIKANIGSTGVRLIHRSTISQPGSWRAVSPDGQRVAVRVNNSLSDNDDNVFVFSTDGTLIGSFRSPHGGEEGVAFWPDEYHVLTPGCDPTGGPRDGLKCHRLDSNDYTLPFADTPLSGINVHLLAVSDKGRYVLGTRTLGWPHGTAKRM